MIYSEEKYQETISFLFSQLPMYQRVGAKAFKKDLTNINALLAGLGNPHHDLKAIHIAGTNGKGTVSFLLSAALQAQGYSTGLYVSPHYKDFRERVRINGQYVSKAYVIKFVAQHKKLFQEVRPSFFEISVALAFCYFRDQKVDIAVVETGLGGRLDSTNVLLPILSVITNIGFDHVNFLGNTLPLIAREKAGIIKNNIPVVFGKKQAETASVFRSVAKEKSAPYYYAEDIFDVRYLRSTQQLSYHQVMKHGAIIYESLAVGLTGPFQKENLQTALAALEVIHAYYPDFLVSDPAIHSGFKHLRNLTGYIGRWQVLGINPLIIADSGHNPAAISSVVAQFEKLDYRDLHIVLGMVNDKDVTKVLGLLPAKAKYYFSKAAIPRGLEAERLQKEAVKFGLPGDAYPSVKAAFEAAKKNAKKEDLIFVGGSVFVVAEVI